MVYWNGFAGDDGVTVIREERPTPRQAWVGQAVPESGVVARRQEPPDHRAHFAQQGGALNVDVSSGVSSRLTFPVDAFSFARFGIWSPDGKAIVVQLRPTGWAPPVSDGGQRRRSRIDALAGLLTSPSPRIGRAMAGSSTTASRRTGWDIWAFNFAERKSSTDPGGAVEPSAGASVAGWPVAGLRLQRVGRVEPDGSHRRGAGKAACVAQAAALSRIWRGNGKELFYVAADDRLSLYRFTRIAHVRVRSQPAAASPRAYRRCWRRFAPTMRCRQTVSGFWSTTSRRKRRRRQSRSR